MLCAQADRNAYALVSDDVQDIAPPKRNHSIEVSGSTLSPKHFAAVWISKATGTSAALWNGSVAFPRAGRRLVDLPSGLGLEARKTAEARRVPACLQARGRVQTLETAAVAAFGPQLAF